MPKALTVYCRIVTLCAFQTVVHSHIHIHLPHILTGNLRGFYFNEHKAFLNLVVEHEVDVKVAHVGMYMLLSCHESIALAKFHDEMLEMGNDTRL